MDTANHAKPVHLIYICGVVAKVTGRLTADKRDRRTCSLGEERRVKQEPPCLDSNPHAVDLLPVGALIVMPEQILDALAQVSPCGLGSERHIICSHGLGRSKGKQVAQLEHRS